MQLNWCKIFLTPEKQISRWHEKSWQILLWRSLSVPACEIFSWLFLSFWLMYDIFAGRSEVSSSVQWFNGRHFFQGHFQQMLAEIKDKRSSWCKSMWPSQRNVEYLSAQELFVVCLQSAYTCKSVNRSFMQLRGSPSIACLPLLDGRQLDWRKAAFFFFGQIFYAVHLQKSSFIVSHSFILQTRSLKE